LHFRVYIDNTLYTNICYKNKNKNKNQIIYKIVFIFMIVIPDHVKDIIKFTEDNTDAEDKHDQGLLLWDHDSNFWSCLSSASVLSSVNLIISLTITKKHLY